jgi:hypothetical protein
LKYTDENLAKQKQLKEMNSKRKPSRASSTAASLVQDSLTTESRSRKRHRDSSIDKARLVSLYDHRSSSWISKLYFLPVRKRRQKNQSSN